MRCNRLNLKKVYSNKKWLGIVLKRLKTKRMKRVKQSMDQKFKNIIGDNFIDVSTAIKLIETKREKQSIKVKLSDVFKRVKLNLIHEIVNYQNKFKQIEVTL